MQKNLKISVFGKNYLISTDENSDDVMQAAQVVDGLMRSKSSGSSLQGDGALAVVVALELAADLAKQIRQIKQMEARVIALNEILLR